MKKKLVIVITGTGSGLGRELSIQLAKNGHDVFACSRDPSKIKAFLEKQNLFLTNLIPLKMDLTKAVSVKATCDYILKKMGKIDVLINNAGYGLIGPIESLSVSQLKRLFAVNFFGPVLCIQNVLPQMKKQKSGLIINISSVSGIIGSPLLGGYCASKFALEGLSECLAMELERFNIKVIVIEPGILNSSFIENIEIGNRLQIMPKSYLIETQRCIRSIKELVNSKKAEKLVKVAKIILQAIEKNQEVFRIQTGDWAKKVVAKKLKEPGLLISK